MTYHTVGRGADPVPGSGVFFYPGIRIQKENNPDLGWTSRIIFPRRWKQVQKTVIILCRSGIRGVIDPGSGMEKFGWGIRVGKIRIRDPGSATLTEGAVFIGNLSRCPSYLSSPLVWLGHLSKVWPELWGRNIEENWRARMGNKLSRGKRQQQSKGRWWPLANRKEKRKGW